MLKDRERRILEYMKSEIRTKGYPPTVREICAALGIKSTSTAHKDIESLVRQGYLKKDPSKPRALMVVDPTDATGHLTAGSGAGNVVSGSFGTHTSSSDYGSAIPKTLMLMTLSIFRLSEMSLPVLLSWQKKTLRTHSRFLPGLQETVFTIC